MLALSRFPPRPNSPPFPGGRGGGETVCGSWLGGPMSFDNKIIRAKGKNKSRGCAITHLYLDLPDSVSLQNLTNRGVFADSLSCSWNFWVILELLCGKYEIRSLCLDLANLWEIRYFFWDKFLLLSKISQTRASENYNLLWSNIWNTGMAIVHRLGQLLEHVLTFGENVYFWWAR